MKTKQLPKKAVSSLAITSFIITLIAGAVVTGTLLAVNMSDKDADTITYQEAIDIASSIPEVATFIQENDINSVSANRENDVWIVEFFAENFDYTFGNYYWMNYAYVEINANNGEVIYFIVQSSSEPNLTEQEAINILLDIPEVGDWVDLHGDIFPIAWYDGYELWYVYLFSNATPCYVMSIVSDWNSSVLWYEIFDPLSDAIHTEAEIIAIVEALPEVQDWVSRNPNYERYIYFISTGQDNGTIWSTSEELCKNILEGENFNTTGGIWYVDYYSTTSADFISIIIDDVTGEVISISTMIVPELTEAEVIAIASTIPEVASFLENITYSIFIEFNEYYGYWYIFFWNDHIYEEYAYVEIADPSGEILYYEVHDIEDPNMTAQEVLDILFAVEEIQDWLENITEYFSYANFYEGFWYAGIYAGNETIAYGNTSIIAYEAVIDDLTGEIVSLTPIELLEPCQS